MSLINLQVIFLKLCLGIVKSNGLFEFVQTYASFVFAFLSTIISILVFYKTVLDNKTNIETTLNSNIQQAKINLDNTLYDISKESSKRRRNNYIIKPIIENYLVALNQACSLYLDKEIKQKRFQSMYSTDIENVFKGSIYKEIIHDNIDGYESLISVHKKWFTIK